MKREIRVIIGLTIVTAILLGRIGFLQKQNDDMAEINSMLIHDNSSLSLQMQFYNGDLPEEYRQYANYENFEHPVYRHNN